MGRRSRLELYQRNEYGVEYPFAFVGMLSDQLSSLLHLFEVKKPCICINQTGEDDLNLFSGFHARYAISTALESGLFPEKGCAVLAARRVRFLALNPYVC